jgi:thiol-disulfide isomerase/thioredoxin
VPLSQADGARDFLMDLRGQTVLVDFWASWCGPCRRSFPWMNRILDKYRKDSFTIVTVNVDNSKPVFDVPTSRLPGVNDFQPPSDRVAA